VPTSHSILFRAVERAFPAKRFDNQVLVEYARQMLVMSSYVPALEGRVVDLVIRRCLELDVEIVIEDRCEGLSSPLVQIRPATDSQQEQEDDEEALAETKESSQLNSSFVEDVTGKMSSEVVVTADKLDALLTLLMGHLDEKIASCGGSEDAAHLLDKHFQQLISAFESKILCTHKTKFVQFLLFFLSMKSERFCAMFLAQLLSLSVSPSVPPLKRQCAVMYYSSFIARASFLAPESVSELAGKLVLWASDYVQENHLSEGDGGLSGSVHALSLNSMSLDGRGRVLEGCEQLVVSDRHLVFYCVVQAACYVLCFHGASLAASHSSSASLRAAWERVLGCELDPLRYCIKSIKWEFVRLVLWVGLVSEQRQQELLAFALQGMRVCRRDSEVSAGSRRASVDWTTADKLEDSLEPILPYRRRPRTGSNLSEGSFHAAADFDSLVPADSFNPLDSFFPFDPCLLKKAHELVSPGYRSWEGVPGVDRFWQPHCRRSSSDMLEADELEGDVTMDESTDGEDGDLGEESSDSDQEGQDPFMRRYSKSKISGDGVQKAVTFHSDVLGGVIGSEEEVTMSGRREVFKRCSPVAVLASEGSERRRRFSITSAYDW